MKSKVKHVEIGEYTAEVISEWLNDYAKYAESTGYLPENDLEQIRYIAGFLLDCSKKISSENSR